MKFITIAAETALREIGLSRPQGVRNEKYGDLYDAVTRMSIGESIQLKFTSKSEMTKVLASFSSWKYRQNTIAASDIGIFRDHDTLTGWIIRKDGMSGSKHRDLNLEGVGR